MVPSESNPEWQAIQAEALRVTGISSFMLGRLEEAIQKLSHSEEIYTHLNDRHNIGLLLMEIGLVHRHAGRYQQALNFYSQALQNWREVNNSTGQATLLNNLGVLHYLRGEYPQAVSFFEKAQVQAQKNGLNRLQGYILASIGDLYADLNATLPAQEIYTQAFEIARRTHDHHLQFLLHLASSSLARRDGDFSRAKEELQTAISAADGSRSAYEQALWNLEAGRLHLAENHVQEAVQVLNQARAYFIENGQQLESARSSLCLAAAAYEQGDLERSKAALICAFQTNVFQETPQVLVTEAQSVRTFLQAIQGETGLAGQSARLIERIEQFEQRIPSLRRELRPQLSSVPFIPPKLAIQVLGRSQVTLDGKPVEVPEWQNQRRVREFFFYLLAHPDGLTKEAIGLIFWPDSSSAQLKLRFKNTIYKLRAALGQDTIVFDGERYWFNRNLDYECDLEKFQNQISRAESTKVSQEKIDAYLEAVKYYQGLYLPEIEGTWVLAEREHLWQAYVSANLNLAQLYLEAGKTEQTLETCQRILEEDDCLEEAYRLIMRVYAAKGNRAEIIRQYERLKQALFEEVGAEPSRQTQLLFESLLR